MKKISSKIIIFLSLTLVLWGGVNFNFEAKNIKSVISVTKIFAQTGIANETVESCNLYHNKATDPVGNAACLSRVQARANASNEHWWKKLSNPIDFVSGIISLTTSTAIVTSLTVILSILGIILTTIGAILDASINLSIAGFKNFVTASNITESWEIIRDIINISFIFILLYIAITTIIGGVGVKTKVLIKDVIIAAILINFSLFFTRVIIDGGNILAVTMYNKLDSVTKSGFSFHIMDNLKIQTFSSLKFFISSTAQSNAIISLIFSIIITCVAMWSFTYGAMLFLLRNIMLLFLMVTSPIGFIGGVLPWFKDKSSKWWSTLLNQVAVAPFFLFMFYIFIRLSDGITANKTFTAEQEYFGGGGNLNYGMFIQSFLLIGVLLIGTRTTKKLAGEMNAVAEKIVSMGKMAAITVATAGAGAFVAGGATAGASLASRGATMAAKGGINKVLGKTLSLTGGVINNTATVATKFKGGIDQIMDAPNATGLMLSAGRKKLISTIKKNGGIDLDFASQIKARKKEIERRQGEMANSLGSSSINDEIKNRNATMENIEAQAKNKINNDAIGKRHNNSLETNAKTIEELTEKIADLNKTIKDNNTNDTDRANAEGAKIAFEEKLSAVKEDSTRIAELQKARLDDAVKDVGKTMGYDVAGHKAKIDELKQKALEADEARAKYISTIRNEETRLKLGAIKEKYRQKSKAEELYDEIEKKIKKEAEEETKKNKTT